MKHHCLYRHWSEDDDLLYVGITVCLHDRIGHHRREALWWPDVGKITIERYLTREAVSLAEMEAVARENPQHNIRGKAYVPQAKMSARATFDHFHPRALVKRKKYK